MKRLLLSLTLTIYFFTSNAQPLPDCSECSKRKLTESDIESLDYNSLYMLRNEIYARKGYSFSIDFLNDYFNSYPWYKPSTDNKEIRLDDVESKNIEFLGLHMMNEVNKKPYVENKNYTPLTNNDIERLFPKEKRKEMGIRPSIFQTYRFEDKSGEYLWILSERPYKHAENDKQAFNDDLKAIKYRIIADSNSTELIRLEEISDKIKEQEDAFLYSNEADISFWTRYTYIDDLDDDGLLEQIITTGTTQVTGYNDNRINIYIFSKNMKTGIQIYNCTAESGLYVTVDRGFYTLPSKIKDSIILQMDAMLIDGLCFLPKEWKNKMSKGMLNIK